MFLSSVILGHTNLTLTVVQVSQKKDTLKTNSHCHCFLPSAIRNTFSSCFRMLTVVSVWSKFSSDQTSTKFFV